jgi:hypothetical protein
MELLLTEPQRTFRAVLIDVARGEWPNTTHPRGNISYTELGREASNRGLVSSFPMLEGPFRGMGAALGVVSTYEMSFGRPLLSALVVQEASGQPGAGFVDLAIGLGVDVGENHEAFIVDEQRLIRDFWRDPDPTRVLDAGLSAILHQLQGIRHDIRRN